MKMSIKTHQKSTIHVKYIKNMLKYTNTDEIGQF